VLEINKCRLAPQVSLDFFATHQRSCALGKKQKDLEGLRLQLYEGSTFAEFLRYRV
jgi:hypothetical protein